MPRKTWYSLSPLKKHPWKVLIVHESFNPALERSLSFMENLQDQWGASKGTAQVLHFLLSKRQATVQATPQLLYFLSQKNTKHSYSIIFNHIQPSKWIWRQDTAQIHRKCPDISPPPPLPLRPFWWVFPAACYRRPSRWPRSMGGHGVVPRLEYRNCMSPAVPETCICNYNIYIYITYEMEINLQSFIVIIGIQQVHHFWTLVRLIRW